MAQTDKRPWRIAYWMPDLKTWKILASFSSYHRADERHDYWSNKYPNAWVEILSQDDPKIN